MRAGQLGEGLLCRGVCVVYQSLERVRENALENASGPATSMNDMEQARPHRLHTTLTNNASLPRAATAVAQVAVQSSTSILFYRQDAPTAHMTLQDRTADPRRQQHGPQGAQRLAVESRRRAKTLSAFAPARWIRQAREIPSTQARR